MERIPDQDAILKTSGEDFCKISPSTMIYAASGTRRAAALAGVETSGQRYADWTQQELFRTIKLIFRHGIRHLVMPMLGPSQFEESTAAYRQYLWRWFEEGLSGEKALEYYRRAGWRVRIACSQYIPELKLAGQQLIENTSPNALHTLWCYLVPEYSQPWQWLLQAAQQVNEPDASDTMAALYGEKIPPAEIYIGTGKLQMSSLQLPLLLVTGPLQCYWSQRPGYSLDQHQLRAILYDYAYLRKTWQKDKSGRAEQALAERNLWERGNVLGLGVRKGPFWYPAPFEG